MITFQPDQADPKWNQNRMTCRDRVKLTLYVDGIDAVTDTQMLNNPHNMLAHLADLDYGINPDIWRLKKEKVEIFSQCCTESFKAQLIRYVNEALFEMVKTPLKDAYIG